MSQNCQQYLKAPDCGLDTFFIIQKSIFDMQSLVVGFKKNTNTSCNHLKNRKGVRNNYCPS